MSVFTMPELASYLTIPLDALDWERGDLLLSLAEAEIFGDVTQPDPIPSRVKGIALEVVARAYRNPSGARTETAGPFTEGRSDETSNAGIYLLDSERARLANALGVTTRMGTIRLGTPYGRDYASPYVPPYPFILVQP